MQRIHALAVCAAFVIGLAASGCGSSEPGGLAGDDPAGEAVTATPASQPERDTREPKQVLADFFQLKREGKHSAADQLLSATAREVIGKMEQKFLPEIAADVRIEFGEVKKLKDDAAHVVTHWRLGSGPQAEATDFTWVLQHGDEGWRIVGMIGQLMFDSNEPAALDFEDEKQIRGYIAYVQGYLRKVQEEQAQRYAKTKNSASPPKAEPAAKNSVPPVETARKVEGGPKLKQR